MGKERGMPLLLHKKNGEVKARCIDCSKLYQPGVAELRSMKRLGEMYGCLCAKCIGRAYAHERYLVAIERERLAGRAVIA